MENQVKNALTEKFQSNFQAECGRIKIYDTALHPNQYKFGYSTFPSSLKELQ